MNDAHACGDVLCCEHAVFLKGCAHLKLVGARECTNYIVWHDWNMNLVRLDILQGVLSRLA